MSLKQTIQALDPFRNTGLQLAIHSVGSSHQFFIFQATDFNLDLEEQGQKFVEKIKVDTEGNTEEYSVPKHGDRVAIDVLKDFTKVPSFFISFISMKSRSTS